jgi:hypothetical protein
MSAENTAAKQRGRPFPKGRSGNPVGKPLGTRNKATIAAEGLLDGEAEAITRKAIEKAKEGDATALRLCLERILPARKDRPVAFTLPAIVRASDAVTAAGALLAAVACGDLTPSEAGELSKLVDIFIHSIEATEFEERLSKLEKAAAP